MHDFFSYDDTFVTFGSFTILIPLQNMKYVISYTHPHQNSIDLQLVIENITQDVVLLKLPTWRPGRYQIQNFAKNIRKFQAFDAQNQPLYVKKIEKSTWQIDTKNSSQIRIQYEYFARQVDAGGSWLKPDLLYINWITCALYLENRKHEPYEIKLQIPDNYRVCCGLTQKNNRLIAQNFDELVDSPLMASPNLQHQTYQCENYQTTFHLWFEGNITPKWTKILNDFQTFSQSQLTVFQDFPASDYHFMFLILPFKYYHGVEHRNSTMIVMGTDTEFENYYQADVLGIASHELFHFWNAIRIRPIELLPYDYSQENYFETGFVIEGLTTYYGDYQLFRCGIWSEKMYFSELNKTFKRHFDNGGRFYKSVAESSTDLWLDGYEIGIPNRKTSIYVKGAISALILDLEIRKATQNRKSLDDVMRFLWQNHGKTYIGYSTQDYIQIVNQVAEQNFQEYFDTCIFGIEPLENRLRNALNFVGCELQEMPATHEYETYLGFQTLPQSGKIWQIAPHSPADLVLSVGDEILTINNIPFFSGITSLDWKTKLSISVRRMNQIESLEIRADEKTYFPQFCIQKKMEMTETEKINFEKWASF